MAEPRLGPGCSNSKFRARPAMAVVFDCTQQGSPERKGTWYLLAPVQVGAAPVLSALSIQDLICKKRGKSLHSAMIPPAGFQPQDKSTWSTCKERRVEVPALQTSSQRVHAQNLSSSPTEGKKEPSPVNLGRCFQA